MEATQLKTDPTETRLAINEPPSPLGVLYYGLIGAAVAAFAWVAFIFANPDPQGAIGLLFTPFVAAPIGFATSLVCLALQPGRIGERVALLLFALLVASLPIGWIIGEVRQMYGWG